MDPGAFSQEDLTRTDALYLSVTIFSTVGFGDISATSQSARLVVTSQMILDLLVLGIGINAFVHAAQVGSRAAVCHRRGWVILTRRRSTRRPGEIVD